MLGSAGLVFQESFSRISIPCVMVTNTASHLNLENLSSVSTDDQAAARYAVEYLINLGHRRIGILSGITTRSQAAANRYKGAMEAFRKHGLPFDKDLECEEAHFDMTEGYYAMKRLIRKMPDLTAVFAMADVVAIGAYRAIADEGLRIPEDISVIGFDGLRLSNFLVPRLTTIAQNSIEIASRSVEILLNNIENGYLAIHETEPFHLVPGDSVARRIL